MDYGATNSRGELSLGEIRLILDLCRENGIMEMDTAEAYGNAEEKLGQAGVEDFCITTKINLKPEEKPGAIEKKTNLCLKRLRVSKLKNLLIHNEERLRRPDAGALVEKMGKLATKGLIENTGFSSYEPRRALRLCQLYGFRSVQLPANVLDNRLFEKDLLASFMKCSVEVQIRSVFLQGILLRKPNREVDVPKQVLQAAEYFRKKCAENNVHPVEGALHHVLHRSAMAKIVFGATNRKEISQILKYTKQKPKLVITKPIKWNRRNSPANWGKHQMTR